MPQQLYSVEQVADLLHLHVKTVRGYVRDGRLPAVRIGKQYRISREDLQSFTGGSAADVARHRHSEVSSIVQIDAISQELASKVSTIVTGSANGRPADDNMLRIQTVYDEERASLKIILLGGLETIAEMLKLISMVVDNDA